MTAKEELRMVGKENWVIAMNRMGRLARQYALAATLLAILSSAAAFANAAPIACTSQAELNAADRASLGESAARILTAIQSQNWSELQWMLMTAEAGDWSAIKGEAERTAALIEGGQTKIRNLYLIDNSSATSTADVQAFCSNQAGTLTVTITLRSLPPGKYAVVLADTVGGKYAGQVGLILAVEQGMWKLGGISGHEGILDGHDGVWYWSHARELARTDSPWAAYLTYDLASYLLVPVNYLSSPNLEKLGQEQSQVMSVEKSPLTFPMTLEDGPRTWKLNAVKVDASLHHADLALYYDAVGITDPASSRTEAVAVMSAFLKHHPGLRENFHGVWAYAYKDGKQGFAIELPMKEIPQ